MIAPRDSVPSLTRGFGFRERLGAALHLDHSPKDREMQPTFFSGDEI